MASERLPGKEQFPFKELPLGNASFPCQYAFEKGTTKTELYNGKSYIKKLCTRL